jgi:predicted chitinase
VINNALQAAVGIGQRRLIATQDTFLKRSPAQSNDPINAGKTLSVTKGFEIVVTACTVENSHYAFESSDARFAGKGYAFMGHFAVIGGVDVPTELVDQDQANYIFQTDVDEAILADLNACLVKFGITDKEDIRQFLAQCAHESGGLRWLKELASGEDYEWREDLGNNQAGDGRKYRGGGVIQLTGRFSYQAFADFMGDPEIVNQGVNYVATRYPVSSGAFWWRNNNMSQFVANGATVEQVSARVNGIHPANGLSDRIYYYERAKVVI